MKTKELHWLCYFFTINAFIYSFISLSYLTAIPQDLILMTFLSKSGVFLIWFFACVALIGQMFLITMLPLTVSLIAYLLTKKRWLLWLTGIASSVLMMGILLLDSLVFHQYRFHMFDFLWEIIQSGAGSQILVFSRSDWFLTGLSFGTMIILEVGLAVFVWKKILKKDKLHRFLPILALPILGLFISYVLIGFGPKNSLDSTTLNYPQMFNEIAKIIPCYEGTLKLITHPQKSNPLMSTELNYPLTPIHTFPPSTPLNVVIIAIDTWRFDMLNAAVTPNIYRFGMGAWNFKNHYSGGNWTQPGIFSLFYSIPETYWSLVLQMQQQPLLLEQFQKHNYQMGVFASASLHFPAFDQTVFKNIPNLSIETNGDSSSSRDKMITQKFHDFLKTRQKNQPFFSFLFYDEVHNWCGSNQPYKKYFQPAIQECDRILLNNETNPAPYMNRYRNAVRFVDELVGEDLKNLENEGLLKNTVVIITADHGEEFNESHLNHWGHASDFNQYQIKTPLIVYWPKLGARTINYQTSHYDIVPTLLTGVLGTTNALSDYSIGYPLLTPSPRPYIIIGSYKNYAILKDQKIIAINDGDHYETRLKSTLTKQISKDLNRYLLSAN